MTMRRFILTGEDLSRGKVEVTGDLFRHMARVLRLKIDTRVKLSNGKGGECVGVIREIGKDCLTITVEEGCSEPVYGGEPRITLFQGLPKGDKMELILQKCTELGVTEIVPFIAERSITRLSADREEDRLRRWRRITEESSRQANRTAVPKVKLARSMADVVHGADHVLKLLLWEAEQTRGLRGVLSTYPKPESIAVIIGPEGGISAAEAEEAQAGGFIPVSLGRRILRTETAGIAALAILQFQWGDLGRE